jgi:hypothetical protein
MFGEKSGVKRTKMKRTGTGTSMRCGMTTADASLTTATWRKFRQSVSAVIHG